MGRAIGGLAHKSTRHGYQKARGERRGFGAIEMGGYAIRLTIVLLLCSRLMRAARSKSSKAGRRTAMKPIHLVLAFAPTLAVSLAVTPASAQGGGKSGVERLYILNCGEGVVGDISR